MSIVLEHPCDVLYTIHLHGKHIDVPFTGFATDAIIFAMMYDAYVRLCDACGKSTGLDAFFPFAHRINDPRVNVGGVWIFRHACEHGSYFTTADVVDNEANAIAMCETRKASNENL